MPRREISKCAKGAKKRSIIEKLIIYIEYQIIQITE